MSEDKINYFEAEKFFGRIGLAMYVFDGNAVVINIRSEAKQLKPKYTMILKQAIVFSLLLFIFFSTVTYLIYRGETKPIFTMSLVPVNGLVLFIFLCVCINAITSYPM